MALSSLASIYTQVMRCYFFFLTARLAMALSVFGLGGFLPLRI
jgi:hypothetical protein